MNELVSITERFIKANAFEAQVTFNKQQAVINAAKCGQELLEIKAACNHGEFEKQVREHFDNSYSTANNYMRVAKSYPYLLDDSKVQTLGLLPNLGQAIAMLSAPDEVKAEVTERIENGETVTVRKIEQLKRLSSDLEKKLNQQVDHAEALAEELAAANQELKDSKKATQSVIDAKAAEAKAQALLDAQAEIQRAENEVSTLKAKIEKQKKAHDAEIDSEVKRQLASMQQEIDRKQFALDGVTKKIAELKEHEKALDKKIGSQIRHEKAIEKLTESFDGAFTAIFDIVDDKDYTVNNSIDLINKWEKRQKSLQSLNITIQGIIDSLKDADNEEEIINAVSVTA